MKGEALEKKGFFEDLLPVFGAGFDPNSSIVECVRKDMKEGGVLLLRVSLRRQRLHQAKLS